MEQKICLDTDFLVNLFRNNEDAREFMKKHEGSQFATTYVNLFELYDGAYASHDPTTQLKGVEDLAQRMRLLNITNEAAQDAGKLRAKMRSSGRPIEVRDLLIGTIAKAHGYAIKTGNRKHFSRIEGLRISE